MQKRTLATRKKLLDTAIKIFAVKGFHGASVDELAAGAGVNKQRIYAYFGNKQGLWDECLREIFINMQQLTVDACEECKDDPAKLTGVLLAKYMSIHRSNPDFRRLLSWANLEPDAGISSLPALDKEHGVLKEIFLKAQKLRAVPQHLSFEVYIFLLMSISYFWNSNRKTLSQTLSGELFSQAGQQRLISETIGVLTP